ncbi:hypothetical protein [Mycobacterium sp. 236(2023)]|uniref:hypothetical protein n=1 Tax=Mycobacterium sp. 236(2023) TaxID=3038163 RepID=UPI00241514EE|nr:hypothetical protein [Mycobacterium sp. 236(2023)]MDG4665727.1 hypothetical protein [Mycobacterium sp. 236(2023)]
MSSAGLVDGPDAERWFLERGLPSVIGRRARWRNVLSRSAPVLAGWAVLMVTSFFVMWASGDSDVDTDDDNVTTLQVLAAVVLILIVPAVVAVTWAVARMSNVVARRTVALVAVVAGTFSDFYEDDPLDVLRDFAIDGSIVIAIVVATGLGLGAIAGWALRITLRHFKSAARLLFRALPVVLLTILVFFNSPLWTISSNIDGLRVGLMVLFLGGVATSYLIAGLLDSVGPLMWHEPESEAGGDRRPLTTLERANVIVVAAVSQIIQAVSIAVVIGLLYLVLGLIVMNAANVNHLTGGGPTQGEWLGVTIPAPPALIRVVVFLMALTYMYICARAVGDGEYRSGFLDPLLADLRAALDARDRLYSKRPGEDNPQGPTCGEDTTPV